MAQLLLQQGKVTEALKYFERAAELSRTEGEIVNALSYAEATRTQLEVQEKYPQLAGRLVCTLSAHSWHLSILAVSKRLLRCSDLCFEEGMLTPKSFIAGYGGQYWRSNAMIAICRDFANTGDAFLVKRGLLYHHELLSQSIVLILHF